MPTEFEQRYPTMRAMIRRQIETWDIEMATEHILAEFALTMEAECAHHERATRLNEHEVLASLDEAGRNKRYLYLKQEGKAEELIMLQSPGWQASIPGKSPQTTPPRCLMTCWMAWRPRSG